MNAKAFLDEIAMLFATRGAAEYHGEQVTQLEHALQAAHLAEQDSRPANWVAAAILHDIGHLLELDSAPEADHRHEELAVRFLERAYSAEVTEPIRLHVAAKRYLCATDPIYSEQLSEASVRSLKVQGGAMSPCEARSFEGHPHFEIALAIRRYDDRAKVPGLATPTFEDFRPFLEKALRK